MPVDERFIDLLNLPVAQLRSLARKAGQKPSPRATKWDLVAAAAGLSRQQLDEIAGDWLYAGRTSVTWIELAPSAPDGNTPELGPGEPLMDRLREALTAVYDHDPLEDHERPTEVTTTPQLVEARIWRPNKVVFVFAVAKRVAKVIHNFEPVDVLVDEFFVAVLRLDRRILEIRASHERAELLANTWLVELMQHFGVKGVNFRYITIDEDELEQIKSRLGAALDTFRGRTNTGSDIDTLRLTKSLTCDDLAAVPTFQDFTDGYEPASVDFVFTHEAAGNVRVRISTVNGSVWFQTPVTEDVVDHVYDIVRAVKGIP